MNEPKVSWLAPMTRVCLRMGRTIRWQRMELDLLRHQNDVLAQKLQQARRDAELLALCAKDRTAALEFLRDAHQIEALDVIPSGEVS